MAASNRMQLIPSTGVLLGAIAAGVVAAILVNVYLGSIESRYTAGSTRILVAKDKIVPGQPLNAKLFGEKSVTGPWTKAFDSALKPEDAGQLDGTKTATRFIGAGEPIFYGDLYDVGIVQPINPGRGYDLVTIPVQTDSSPGQQLQPGGYVRLYAVFNLDPDPRKDQRETFVVIENVQVRAVDGSTRPIPADKRARYDNISILVTQDQALQIRRLQRAMAQKEFTIDVTHRPDQLEYLEPKINPDVLRFIESRGTVPPLP